MKSSALLEGHAFWGSRKGSNMMKNACKYWDKDAFLNDIEA